MPFVMFTFGTFIGSILYTSKFNPLTGHMYFSVIIITEEDILHIRTHGLLLLQSCYSVLLGEVKMGVKWDEVILDREVAVRL